MHRPRPGAPARGTHQACSRPITIPTDLACCGYFTPATLQVRTRPFLPEQWTRLAPARRTSSVPALFQQQCNRRLTFKRAVIGLVRLTYTLWGSECPDAHTTAAHNSCSGIYTAITHYNCLPCIQFQLIHIADTPRLPLSFQKGMASSLSIAPDLL